MVYIVSRNYIVSLIRGSILNIELIFYSDATVNFYCDNNLLYENEYWHMIDYTIDTIDNIKNTSLYKYVNDSHIYIIKEKLLSIIKEKLENYQYFMKSGEIQGANLDKGQETTTNKKIRMTYDT